MEATLTDFRKATTGAKRAQDGPLVRFTVDGVLVAYSKFVHELTSCAFVPLR